MLRPAKRLETLIDAVAELASQGRAIRLRIIGAAEPPSYRDSLQRRAAARGLGTRVEFAGYVPLGPALNQEYRSADIYAFPSLTEGAARTLLEAAAQSLPCVLTDVGGVRDLFADGQSALVVPANDSAAMARAIGRFIDDGPLRRTCIANAYAIAAQHTCREFVRGMVQRLKAAARKTRRRRLASPEGTDGPHGARAA